MDDFTQRVIHSKFFTRPIANFVKRRMDDTMDEWHLTAKEEKRATKEFGASMPPSPPDSASSDDDRVPARYHERHAKPDDRPQATLPKARKNKRDHATLPQPGRYVATFSTSSCSLKVRKSDSDSSHERKELRMKRKKLVEKSRFSQFNKQSRFATRVRWTTEHTVSTIAHRGMMTPFNSIYLK